MSRRRSALEFTYVYVLAFPDSVDWTYFGLV